MRSQNRNYELKTLRQIKKLLDEPEKQNRNANLCKYAFYVIGAIALLLGYFTIRSWEIDNIWGIASIALGGICMGIAGYLDVAQKQWPIVSEYINKVDIENKINELET